MSKRLSVLVLLVALLGAFLFFIFSPKADDNNNTIESISSHFVTRSSVQALPSATPTPAPIPSSYEIPLRLHVFQSFNNCGPAALSMALSYYGINRSQKELGDSLRPYQIPGGDNDDKSVTLEELAEKSKEFGLTPYHRPNGDINTLKQFIAMDIPVITRTWTKPNEDIGHYRVVRGYNNETRELIQDDSLQDKNLKYSYDDFNVLWKKFNYEYLVLVPDEKLEMAAQILGENLDQKKSWLKAVELSEKELAKNPDDISTRFNLSVALYEVGSYARSVREFEKIETRLPFRTLWYQIEPIKAYYELGNYDRVFEITDKILNNQNRAYSEAYLVRGDSYLKLGNTAAAKQEYKKAVLYNTNLVAAKQALEKLN